MNVKNAARERIQWLADQNDGRVTASMVVADAKKKTSPLHACFDWDNDVAGDKWRLEQARRLIQSVRIETVTTTMRVSCPAYVRDPARQAGEQGHVAVSRLRSERDLAIEALTAEFSRVAATLRRAREIAVGLGLEAEVERMFGPLDQARSRLEEMRD